MQDLVPETKPKPVLLDPRLHAELKSAAPLAGMGLRDFVEAKLWLQFPDRIPSDVRDRLAKLNLLPVAA